MGTLATFLLSRPRALVNLGTRRSDPADARRIRVVNVLSIASLVVSTPYTVLYEIAGLYDAFYGNLAYQAILVSIPFLHRFRHNIGALVLAASSTAALLGQASALGLAFGLHLFYFVFPAAGFLIFDRRWIGLAFTAIAFGCFAAAHLYFRNRASDFPLDDNLSYLASAFLAILIISATILYAFLQVERAEAVAERERQRSDDILSNILPAPIADRLKTNPNAMIADAFDSVTILFADIVGFTPRTRTMEPDRLVAFLNRIFTEFDALADRHGLEKIKTVGDAYVAAAGIPEPKSDHLEAVADTALEMIGTAERLGQDMKEPLQIRIGIHTGPAIAGVIGARKFAYDVWGHTVNMAARMEAHGVPSRIHVTRDVRDALSERYIFEPRGLVDIKGVGPIESWFLVGNRPDAVRKAAG